MLRTGASRVALRSVATPGARPAGATFGQAASPLQWTAKFTSLTSKRPHLQPLAQLKPIQTALLRRTLAAKIDTKAEEKYAHEKLKPTPEIVSSSSSTHAMFSEVGAENPDKDIDMLASVRNDLDMVKGTFDMQTVPRQAYYIGLAGVLPYLGTSLSTVFCAWEINHATGGLGSVMTAQTAETMLHILEPLQVGYGAVILSFLGAIHWGLEFAGYGGYHGYRRYAIGVLTPAVAWPTLMMPIEYALISQFAAFTLLYYVDTRAAYRGWTPPWYGIYRFVLTFIVGVSIVVSLIGRGEVSGKVARAPGAVDKITALRESAQEGLQREEETVRIKKAAEAAKADDGDDEAGAEEGTESDGSDGKEAEKEGEQEKDDEKDDKKDDKKDDQKEDKKDNKKVDKKDNKKDEKN